MKRIVLVLAVVLAASFVTAWAQAEEVEIVELETFTMAHDNQGVEQTDFDVWDPVMYEVTYRITGGTTDQEYKAVIVITSMRDRLKEVEYHTYVDENETYTTKMLNLAGPGDVGIDKWVKYKIKLKDGSTLLDRDVVRSQITVNPVIP